MELISTKALEFFRKGLIDLKEQKNINSESALIIFDITIQLALKKYFALNNIEYEPRSSFPKLLEILRDQCPNILFDKDVNFLEFAHSRRNILVHDGNDIYININLVKNQAAILIKLLLSLYDLDLEELLQEIDKDSQYYGQFLYYWYNIKRRLLKTLRNYQINYDYIFNPLLEKFKEVQKIFKDGNYYKNPEKLIPILIYYYFLMILKIDIEELEFFNGLEISYDEFKSFKIQTIDLIPTVN